MTYSIDPESVRIIHSYRGVRTHASIVCAGDQVGAIEDHAERIGPDVTIAAEHRAPFLACARDAGYDQTDARDAISAYARKLLGLASPHVDDAEEPISEFALMVRNRAWQIWLISSLILMAAMVAAEVHGFYGVMDLLLALLVLGSILLSVWADPGLDRRCGGGRILFFFLRRVAGFGIVSVLLGAFVAGFDIAVIGVSQTVSSWLRFIG